MAVDIIDSLFLGSDLPLDSRYIVNSIYDVSMYWFNGMQLYETSTGRVWLVEDASNSVVTTVALVPDISAYAETVDGSLTYLYDIFERRNEPNGFVNKGFDSSIYIIDDVFYLTPTDGSFGIYYDSKYLSLLDSSVNIPAAEGFHYAFIEEDGSLNTTQSFSDFGEKLQVAIIYWSTIDSSAIYLTNQRHGIVMDHATQHLFAHQFGLMYTSGIGLYDFSIGSLEGGGTTDEEAQFSIEDGLLHNQDLTVPIIDDIPQQLTPFKCPVYHLVGMGAFTAQNPREFPLVNYSGGSGRVAYNRFDPSLGYVQTEVTNNYYVNAHILALNDTMYPIASIQGLAEYDNIADAREGAIEEIRGILVGNPNIPNTIWKVIGSVIYRTSDTYSNSPLAKVVETDVGKDYVDFRTVDLRQESSDQHGILTGLSNDTHKQYTLLSGRPGDILNIANIHAFDQIGNVIEFGSARLQKIGSAQDASDAMIKFDVDAYNAIQDVSIQLRLKESSLGSQFYWNTGDLKVSGNEFNTVLSWNYSTTTVAANPGSGYFRFNSTNVASATALYISDENSAGQEVTSFLAAIKNGDTIYFQNIDVNGESTVYTVTGSVTDVGNWFVIPISFVNGQTISFTNDDEFSTIFLYSSATTSWGDINGTLSDQTDLQSALDLKVNLAGDTMTGDLTVPNLSVINDVSITKNLTIDGSVIIPNTATATGTLTAIDTNGRLIKTQYDSEILSNEVYDISNNFDVSILTGIYYVNTTVGNITIRIPDSIVSNDGAEFKVIKQTGANNVYVTTVGGTQLIGSATTQTISQNDRGITIVSDYDNTKWLITQDSRFLQGTTQGEFQYWDVTLNAWQPTGGNITWDASVFNIGSTPLLTVDVSNRIISLNNEVKISNGVSITGDVSVTGSVNLTTGNVYKINDIPLYSNSYIDGSLDTKVDLAGDTMTGDLITTGLVVNNDASITRDLYIGEKTHFNNYTNTDPSYGDLWSSLDPSGHLSLMYAHHIGGEDASSWNLVNRLLRTSNDWANFPDSSSLDTGDRILIEDAQDEFKKKWISAEAFQESVTGGFGQYAAYAQDLTVSSTTATTPQLKLQLITDASAGTNTYRIGWTLQITNSNNAKITNYEVTVDGSIIDSVSAKVNNGESYANYSGFQHLNLGAGAHTIDVNYWAGSNTARIQNVRIEFFRAGVES